MTTIRTIRTWILVALAAALLAVPAHANPAADLLEPPRDPAKIMPTPPADAFYVPPPGFEAKAPGTLLAVRTTGGIWPTARALELLLRSTDAHDRPIPAVATLLLPNAPWTGPGTRPLVSYNHPISSLGSDCAPSVELKQSRTNGILPIQLLLTKNYAVVVPDHQGPRQAYAAGRLGGHIILDAVRAVLHTPMPGLDPASPVVMTGYSGGAIATSWAAQLAATYAPELTITAALIGGGPTDYRLVVPAMNGRNAASGVLLAAALGLAREYPELLSLLNDNGWRLAQLFKDMCVESESNLGALLPIRVEQLTNVPDPLSVPIVRQVLAENRPGATAPRMPIFLYHGRQDIWIPYASSEVLYRDWCAHGARVRLQPLPGEHFIVGVTEVLIDHFWVEDALAGTLVPQGCNHN
ncbi:lipase family protein [Nocardia terrae]|uniref:lipase family protein n=1 Tax=Nocardia terrae TaxID=2675851 RepID=UPI002E25B02D